MAKDKRAWDCLQFVHRRGYDADWRFVDLILMQEDWLYAANTYPDRHDTPRNEFSTDSVWTGTLKQFENEAIYWKDIEIDDEQ